LSGVLRFKYKWQSVSDISDDHGLSRQHDGSLVTDNEFGDASADQFLGRRRDHMCHM